MVLQLSPTNVCHLGLVFVGEENTKTDHETVFHAHYGSSSIVFATMWQDLQTVTVDDEVILTEKENSLWGFKRFLVAHFFLWAYPKNARLISSRFKICEKYSRGVVLWEWIGKIAILITFKVRWDPHLDDPLKQIFIITVDGVDFRIWETKHPLYNIDTGMCSEKFNASAVKYEIAISLLTGKCVWINGPFRGGENDKNMFRSGLKQKIAPGKLVIADRGYVSSNKGEEMLCTPNPLDSKAVNNFKSRSRCRHETFNGRLKNFASLRDTFRHGVAKHKIAFEAVVSIVQYQLDNGAPLYTV